jgi:hypothetical protein
MHSPFCPSRRRRPEENDSIKREKFAQEEAYFPSCNHFTHSSPLVSVVAFQELAHLEQPVLQVPRHREFVSMKAEDYAAPPCPISADVPMEERTPAAFAR